MLASCHLRQTPPAIAGFEDGRQALAKKWRQPLSIGKTKEASPKALSGSNVSP